MITSGQLCVGSQDTRMLAAGVVAHSDAAPRPRPDSGISVSRNGRALLLRDRISQVSTARILLPNDAFDGVSPNALPGVNAWSPPV